MEKLRNEYEELNASPIVCALASVLQRSHAGDDGGSDKYCSSSIRQGLQQNKVNVNQSSEIIQYVKATERESALRKIA